MIFSAFNNILINERERSYYDDPAYLYRTYYMLELFQENDRMLTVKSDFINGNFKLMEIGCVNDTLFPSGTGNAKETCAYLLSQNTQVNKVYIMTSDPKEVTKIYEEMSDGNNTNYDPTIKTITYNLYLYLRSLQPIEGYDYYFVVEYITTVEDSFDKNFYYATIPFN